MRLKDLNFFSRFSFVFGPTPGMASSPERIAPLLRLLRWKVIPKRWASFLRY